jgi:hypothetical protein
MRLRRRQGSRPPGGSDRAAGRPDHSHLRAPKALARTTLSTLADLVAIVRKVFVWAARLWLAAAQLAGEIVLGVWEAAVLPPLKLGLRALRAALRFSEREVTPARGLAVAALAATIALGASQFSDYRAVEIGASQYQPVENVAPAPQWDPQSPRSAHGVALFAISVAALFVTAFAVGRNWRLARLLTVLGMAAIGICLLVDAPQGLREGNVAIQYEGAKAILLAGFWAQLWSAVTLAVVGPLLAAQLRSERAGRHPHEAKRLDRSAVASPLPAPQRSSGVGGAAT